MALSIDISSKDIRPIVNPLRMPGRAQSNNVGSDPSKPKKKSLFRRILLFLGVLLVIGGGYYAFRFYQLADTIGIKIRPGDILNPIKPDPELKKDSTGTYTAVLLVGIDTRSNGWIANTDTMILALYNYETSDVTMISIPRDFTVEQPAGYQPFKINAVYSRAEGVKEGDGLNFLVETLEEVTGLEIQYYGMINFRGFREIVDTVGGITVNVEKAFTDYCYPPEADTPPEDTHPCGIPGELGLFQTISFKSGPQTMDGKIALRFARSRHSSVDGTDYGRARRQQKVINAIKDKVLSSETLLNPVKILELMSTIEKNIKLSEFTTEDIQAAIKIAEEQDSGDGKSYSFVLDPGIGIGNNSVINGYAPALGVGNYSDIQGYISAIMEYPGIYSEDARNYGTDTYIRIYDTGAGAETVLKRVEDLKKKFPYLNIQYNGFLFSDKEGTIVYSNVSGEYTETVNTLAEIYKTTQKKKPSYITSNLYGEHVTILMGKKPAPVTSESTEAQ